MAPPSSTPPSEQQQQQQSPLRPAVELERLAGAITRQHEGLQKRLGAVRSQLATALEELKAAREELQEAESRLDEIDDYLEDIAEEMRATRDPKSVQCKQSEYQELLEERADEIGLLAQLEHVLHLRVSVATHLRRMVVHLVREIARVKDKEQLLAVLALRVGAVKLTAQPRLRKL